MRLAGLCALAIALICAPAAAGGPSPVDDLLARCPTDEEVGTIASQVPFTFDSDPTAGALVCRASEGSADLTRLQQRAYQALLAMEGLGFRQPLPFTDDAELYDWFVQAVRGVRFRSDVPASFCCDPQRVVNVKVPAAADLRTSRWVDPAGGWRMKALVDTLTHEARHAEGPLHTCGSGDATFGEAGAWGSQYFLDLWQALYSGPFLTAPGPYDAYYRDAGLAADAIAEQRICTAPAADLSVSIAAPATAPRGGSLPYAITVRNGGPAAAPRVYLYSAIPQGAFLNSTLAGAGSCIGPAGGRNGSVGCSLGPLEPGRSTSVQLNFRVFASSDQRSVSNRESPTAVGTHVSGTVHDANPANNSAGMTTPLVSVSAGATVGGATGIRATRATVTGTVDSNGTDATYHFEYGETPAYGSTTPERNVRFDGNGQLVSEPLTELRPATTYHFRLVAENASGATVSADAAFTTRAVECVVPGVTGRPLATAKRMLRRAHCATGRVTRKHSRARRSRVLAQRPRAGTRLAEGARVRLVVSLGRRPRR